MFAISAMAGRLGKAIAHCDPTRAARRVTRRATAVSTPAETMMTVDEVGRGGRTGADSNERRKEEGPPRKDRRGRNDAPSARAEHARDGNPQKNDETAYRARLHALLRRSDAWRTQTLVRLAPSRGFVDAETRQSAWPRVLGIAEIDARRVRRR